MCQTKSFETRELKSRLSGFRNFVEHSITLPINCATAHLVVISLLRRHDAIALVRLHRRRVVISLLLGAKTRLRRSYFLTIPFCADGFDFAPTDFAFCAEENIQ